MRSRILALSSDNKWCDGLSKVVSQLPHSLEVAASAARGWDAVEHGQIDLLMLDLELPSLERLGWFKLMRQTVPGRGLAAILASVRSDDDEIAEAFEHDADDFLSKDCEQTEMTARLKAVLRRRTSLEWREEGPLKIGAVTLDASRHQCLVRRMPVELNPREFQLLEVLMRKAGRVLSRSYLLETIWGMSRAADTRAVDVAVSRLRKALGRRAGRWVETIERYGYRFRNPEEFVR